MRKIMALGIEGPRMVVEDLVIWCGLLAL